MTENEKGSWKRTIHIRKTVEQMFPYFSPSGTFRQFIYNILTTADESAADINDICETSCNFVYLKCSS